MSGTREPGDSTSDAGDTSNAAGGAGEPVDAGSDAATQAMLEIEAAILGSPRALNRLEVTDQAGVSFERANALWRALGFPATQDDEQVLFNAADVEALRLASWLEDAAIIPRDVELTLVRSMGRGFARLAEWEISQLAANALSENPEPTEEIKDLVASIMPVMEDLQNYVWRRHLAQAAGRLLLRPTDGESDPLVVGFADIVGFTRRSRDLATAELAALVDLFEAYSFDVVTGHGGRVVKTIGDEILFVVDDPIDGARIALDLSDGEEVVEDFPTLRVGLAYGPVLTRVGDVFGPVVNVAARLTSLARPGRILIDRELRGALRPHEDELRIRRSRTTSVRGYSRLDTWALRRPKGSRPPEPTPGVTQVEPPSRLTPTDAAAVQDVGQVLR